MLPIDGENIRDVLTALAIILCLMLFATPAQAQFGSGCTPVSPCPVITMPGSVVSDSPVETSTAAAATSLTTAGGAGRFQPQAQYLNSLMQTMASGVADAGTFASLYPGWVDFGPDAATKAAQITNSTLTTYANAITVAQSQAADFAAEDAHLQTLETCNAASIGVLQAVQCGNEINLAVAQQTQLLRQMEITRLIVEAVHDGEQLNEKAQAGANSQTSLTTAAQQ